jgi:SpoIID/LytB domain protein
VSRHRGTGRATRTRTRQLFLAFYALLLAAGVTTGVAASGRAEAAAGDVTISGHGFGHGRGLSQWGAYGYATAYGWNHLSILSHYYGNATFGNIGDPLITVRLTAMDNAPLRVTSQAPFTAGGWQLNGGVVAQISRNPDGTAQLTTFDSCNGTQTGTITVGSSEINTMADPVDDISKMLTVCATGRTYRGSLTLAYDGTGVRTVNTLFMEDYLRGVVPRESSASWGSAAGGAGLNALMAQAVAARSYSQAENRYSYAKTCDTTACQVYGGAGLNGSRIEDPRTDLSVANTAGQVMMFGTQVARTEFSSSSGGYTAGGTFPAVPDDGDLAASPYANWNVVIPGATVSGAFGVGTLQSITVLSRNGLGADGGRVTKVRVTGLSRYVDVSGDDFRSALGLKSDWFSIVGIEYAVAPVITTVTDATTGNIPDVSPSQPASVVSANGMTTVFARGTDDGIWYRTGTGLQGYGPGYSAWQAIPGTRATSGPAVVTSDGHWIDIVVRGADSAYWHNAGPLDANGKPAWFVGWQPLGGTFTTAPSIAAIGSNRLAVAGRGTDATTHLKIWDGQAWSAWGGLGGQSYSAPSLTADVGNQRYLVTVIGSDSRVWQVGTSLTAPQVSGSWVGGGVASTLTPASSAASWTAGQSGGLTLGGGDHSAVLLGWDGSSLGLGGAFTSVISIAPQWDGSYYLFGRGLDRSLWMARYVNGVVSTWMPLGGAIV